MPPELGRNRLFERNVPWPVLLLAFLYVVLTVVTKAFFLGDTGYYASSILGYSGARDLMFWDFGHILWRPAMWALLHGAQRLSGEGRPDHLLFLLMGAVNWLAGLGCILILYRVVRRFADPLVAGCAVFALMVSQVFLNYVHTGTAYVPGLFFLICGLGVVSDRSLLESASLGPSVLVGVLGALAALLWLPYLFALPGLFLCPVLLHGSKARYWLFVLRAVAICAAVATGVYFLVDLRLRLFSVQAVHGWILLSSHSIDHLGGFPRAVFGFNRAWFDVGRDGIQFRRFLLHDPYSQESAPSLLLAGTWKLALTYSLLCAIAAALATGGAQGRRMLCVLAFFFVPVFSFGVKWQGTDMERCVAAFPAIVLAGAFAVEVRPVRALKVACVVFILSLSFVNVRTDLRWVRDAYDRNLSQEVSRIGAVPEQSYVFVVPGDPLIGVPTAARLDVLPLLDVGYSYATEWRGVFAVLAGRAWQQKRDVWIFRGFLQPRPQPQWGWVEGAEPGVRWEDVYSFFTAMRTSDPRGEFVRVPPVRYNLDLLRAVSRPSNYLNYMTNVASSARSSSPAAPY